MLKKLLYKLKCEKLEKPFSRHKIKSIHMHTYPDSKYHSGTIEFENGGKERFEGKSFEKLIETMHKFIDIL